ncbi:MAG TPA: hypothetical protein VF755_14305 [Catenuloplanes sp.]|jgi:hypothetical protein
MTTTATRPNAGRGRAAIAAKTLRTDRWWFPPLITFLGLSAWLAYGLVRVLMHKWYWVADYHYLTPFYSPCITDRCIPEAAHFGTILPSWWIIPEAAFTLPFLLLFRLTCYYYRKAYYRAFWLSPPACAVPDGHKKYTGETRFPLLGQNLHRYAFYAAAIISLINTYDAILAFHSPQGFGFGLGNLVLLGNVIMLWAYTISCHSCRHIIGGRMKHFSKHPVRYRAWTFVSKLNAKHMQLAWITLGTLMVTDFYIMALSAGWFSDLRFIN